MINLKVLSYKAHKRFISHSRQIFQDDIVSLQNCSLYENLILNYIAENLFSEIMDLLFYVKFERINKHNELSTKPIIVKPITTYILAILKNLFGYIFCKINKCTALNTFIWVNPSG